jgi:hypothetical protein
MTGSSTRILKYVEDLIRELNADIGRKDFFEMASIFSFPYITFSSPVMPFYSNTEAKNVPEENPNPL